MLSEEQNIIDIVKKSSPAVVSIIISEKKQKKFGLKKTKNSEKVIGGGSGFIISKDGIILTNRHVVSDKNANYRAELSDGKSFPVTILARDPINDIAILKIEASEPPFLELGQSENLQIGQTVLAIGNALSRFHNSVSRGIIAGLLRVVQAEDEEQQGMQNLRGLIQTDAAINPGNSGGPMLDTNGKVIGINAVIAQDADNISFAIPIQNAKKDIEDIKKIGKIVKPSLGVRYLVLNNELQEKYNLPVNHGAWILKEHLPDDYAISPGSAADMAGMKENDIILEFKGIKIANGVGIDELVEKSKVGEEVKIKVLRGKKEKILIAILQERL